ncbi:MAG: hypothetical protein WA441_12845 [Methyloceanibacter sp.]
MKTPPLTQDNEMATFSLETLVYEQCLREFAVTETQCGRAAVCLIDRCLRFFFSAATIRSPHNPQGEDTSTEDRKPLSSRGENRAMAVKGLQ